MYEFLPFRLDSVNQCLWRQHETAPDERMALTPKAFAVLRYLVEHAGRLVPQEELLEAVWPETFIKPEVLKSRIFELRRALRAADLPGVGRYGGNGVGTLCVCSGIFGDGAAGDGSPEGTPRLVLAHAAGT
jgi:hypothetical protein